MVNRLRAVTLSVNYQ